MANEQHTESRFVTVTVEYRDGQSPTADLLGSHALGGQIVAVSHYDATTTLETAEAALREMSHPGAKALVQTMKSMELTGYMAHKNA